MVWSLLLTATSVFSMAVAVEDSVGLNLIHDFLLPSWIGFGFRNGSVQ